jgi:uncharacterized membrane protein
MPSPAPIANDPGGDSTQVKGASGASAAPTSPTARRLGVLFAVLNGLLFAGYPIAVYIGLTRFSARGLGLVLGLLLLPGLVHKLRRARREDLLTVARLPLSIFALLALSAWLDDKRFVFALPVLINGALLAQFAASLRSTPLVERFARMQQPTLSPAQVAYCRSVTKVWCAFFVLNATTSALLAWRGPLSLWALYNGLIAYVLMGTVASVEYVVRKFRFREYGSGLHDRVLARLFPPPPAVP